MLPGSRQKPNRHCVATHRMPLAPPRADTIRIGSRRWFLQTGLAGVAGVSLPAMLAGSTLAVGETASRKPKSIILFWLSGGPSHIDMWDPKPDAPQEIRSPTPMPDMGVTESDARDIAAYLYTLR